MMYKYQLKKMAYYWFCGPRSHLVDSIAIKNKGYFNEMYGSMKNL